jgi:hypothetical protein
MDPQRNWEVFFSVVDTKLSEIDADFATPGSRKPSPRRSRRLLPRSARGAHRLAPLRSEFVDAIPVVLEPITNYKFFPARRTGAARIYRPLQPEHPVFRRQPANPPVLIGTPCE